MPTCLNNSQVPPPPPSSPGTELTYRVPEGKKMEHTPNAGAKMSIIVPKVFVKSPYINDLTEEFRDTAEGDGMAVSGHCYTICDTPRHKEGFSKCKHQLGCVRVSNQILP